MKEKRNLFGQELRKLRKEAIYTQDQLAKFARISASYISQLETGGKKPTDRVITKLAGALDIPENRLLMKVDKIKMDFASTFVFTKETASDLIAKLPDKEWEDLQNYLAFLKVKSAIKD
jgi:transcriptional regulator with XRE-family HTH domain